MSQYPLARLPGLVALIFLVLFSLPDVFIHLVEAGVNTYSLNQTYFYTDSVQCSNSSVFAVSFSKPNNSTQKCVPT